MEQPATSPTSFQTGNLQKDCCTTEATETVNATSLKQIDPELSNQRFDAWLNRLLPPSTERKWDLDGCEGRGLQPLCLVSVNRLANGSSVLISLNLEKQQRGLKEPPAFYSASFYKVGDKVENYSSLHQFEKDFKRYLSKLSSREKNKKSK